METTELEVRANAKAHEKHVHIFAVPGRPGVFVTKSKSDPTQKYYLAVSRNTVACNCKGFMSRRSCLHVEALRNRLGRESQAAHEAPRPRASVSDLYGD